jgi:hypothetical protein
MAFGTTSRYASLQTVQITVGDRTISYVRRRFLPRGGELPLLSTATLADSDRLDLLTARALGDPEQFWRVCDANDAMDPNDLETPGRSLRIPLPQP